MTFNVYLNDSTSSKIPFDDDEDHYTVIEGGALRVTGKDFGATVYAPMSWVKVEEDLGPESVPDGKELAV